MVRSKKLPSWIEYFISPASLATWIMDEGFRESKGLTIRLFDFSKEDCTKLALILFKKFKSFGEHNNNMLKKFCSGTYSRAVIIFFLARTVSGGKCLSGKSSALKSIAEIEQTKRGPYCGVIGYVENDQALLSVGIRIFWSTGDEQIHFGTGAGITWASDPESEWEETALKAKRLIAIASGVLV